MQSYFDSIGIELLQEFVEIQQEENIHLEFKLLQRENLQSRDYKRLISKSFSGFANSSGGIVIWGVDCRKNEDGIDAVNSLKPIENLKFCLSRINELCNEALTPALSGITNAPIFQDENSGYIKSLIPEGSSGPYMAKLGEDRYFKRSGSSFYKMEHFDIMDMFGKRKRGKIELRAYCKNAYSVGIIKKYYVTLEMLNQGRGIIKNPYVSVRIDPPYGPSPYGINGTMQFNREQSVSLIGKDENLYIAQPQFILHPNQKVDIFSIETTGTAADTFEQGPVTLHVVAGAEEVEQVMADFTVEGSK